MHPYERFKRNKGYFRKILLRKELMKIFSLREKKELKRSCDIKVEGTVAV